MAKCYTNYTNIGKFISNINSNWRNSIYITCSICKHKKESCCDDILASFDADGNEYLESIGVEKQHHLGVKSRE
mgnify:CR=1 FL=1